MVLLNVLLETLGVQEIFITTIKCHKPPKRVQLDLPWDGTDKSFAVLLKCWLILTVEKYLHPFHELPCVVLNLNQL